MIVDVHAHVPGGPGSRSERFRAQAARAYGDAAGPDLERGFDGYWAAAPDGVRTVVFGGKARLSGLWVDDREVAGLVARHPDRLTGFLAVDPTQPGWRDELRHGHEQLGLRGVKLLPMYAGFRPDDPVVDDLWVYAARHDLPVLLHTGTTFVAEAPLECTLPRHLDAVARRFPDVRIVMAHLGHPYEGECIAVVRKHERVFADVSALHYRPFQLHHSLMLAQEYGVWHKLLFGSDYPYTTVDATVEGLRGLNERLDARGAARLHAREIEALIERDALAVLGLA